MIRTMKKALEHALAISEDPKKIKESMEAYFAKAGYDRRYKFKWEALSGNHRYTFSGIFEYAGQRYYFNRLNGLHLEKI